MILLNSTQDSWENEVLFVKIAARMLDFWFNTFSGPKWPKCSFWVLNHKVQKFLRFHDFEISGLAVFLAFISWIHAAIFSQCSHWIFPSGLLAYLFLTHTGSGYLDRSLKLANWLAMYYASCDDIFLLLFNKFVFMSMHSMKFCKNGCLTYYNSPLAISHLWHMLKNDLVASFLGISFPTRCWLVCAVSLYSSQLNLCCHVHKYPMIQ